MGKKAVSRRSNALRRNVRKYGGLLDSVLSNLPHSQVEEFAKFIPVKVMDLVDDIQGKSVETVAVNVAPPFSHMFFELGNLVASNQRFSHTDYVLGAFIKSYEAPDDESIDFKWMCDICFVIEWSDGKKKSFDESVRYFVTNKGQLNKLGFRSLSRNANIDESNINAQQLVVFSVALRIVFHALSLMNCHNVVLLDDKPNSSMSRDYETHFGHPLVTYKTLRIKPTSKSGELFGSNDYQDVTSYHIRRGNFAHYSEAKPLFGKFSGMFWRPATTVGDRKNGVVIKDYEVKPDGQTAI